MLTKKRKLTETVYCYLKIEMKVIKNLITFISKSF